MVCLRSFLFGLWRAADLRSAAASSRASFLLHAGVEDVASASAVSAIASSSARASGQSPSSWPSLLQCPHLGRKAPGASQPRALRSSLCFASAAARFASALSRASSFRARVRQSRTWWCPRQWLQVTAGCRGTGGRSENGRIATALPAAPAGGCRAGGGGDGRWVSEVGGSGRPEQLSTRGLPGCVPAAPLHARFSFPAGPAAAPPAADAAAATAPPAAAPPTTLTL